jgi:hypothetical protein
VSCCWSHLPLHHTLLDRGGGVSVALHVCNTQRRRPLRRWDWIRLRGGDTSMTTPTMFIWMFLLCNLQGYVDMISPTCCWHLVDPILDLFVCLVGICFFYAAKTFSGIRVRSMRRCFTRVKCNIVIVGVDVLLQTYFLCTSWCHSIVGLKWPRLTLHDCIHETGSALDVWLAPHMWVVGVNGFTTRLW